MNTTSLFEILEKSAVRTPHKTALIENGKKITYSALIDEVSNLSGILKREHNISQGSVVGILLPNEVFYAVSIFAISKLGAIAVPINTRLGLDTIEYILNDTQLKLVLTNKELAEKCNGVFSKVGVITTENIKNKRAKPVPRHITKKGGVAMIMYTSGTTGKPKGAMMTNENLIFNCKSAKKCFHLKSSDIHLIVVPLFHVTGLNSQLLASVYCGSTAVLLPSYNTSEVMKLLRSHHVTILIGVPTVFILLLAKFGTELKTLTSLVKVGYAGAPMPVQTIISLKELLPQVKCYNFYGLTETSSITTVLPDSMALKFPASVGIPADNVRVKIDQDTGELLIKGGNIVKGYLNNLEATKKAIVAGWLHSGDLAKIDSGGRVYLLGRIKEVINRGGEKIFPIPYENKLCNHPAVLEAAVVGVPDPVFGEAVRVCIVQNEKFRLSKEDIDSYCRANLAEYEVPKEIIFLKELPRNPNGKVQKSILKELKIS